MYVCMDVCMYVHVTPDLVECECQNVCMSRLEMVLATTILGSKRGGLQTPPSRLKNGGLQTISLGSKMLEVCKPSFAKHQELNCMIPGFFSQV